MRSDATTVEDYLAALPEDRRAALAELRNLILAHLPEGYVEAMRRGMIAYEVPLETQPRTYNGQPLHTGAFPIWQAEYDGRANTHRPANSRIS